MGALGHGMDHDSHQYEAVSPFVANKQSPTTVTTRRYVPKTKRKSAVTAMENLNFGK